MDKEKIMNNIKELDQRISMRQVIDNLKYKRFKKIELYVRLATLMITSGIVGAKLNEYLSIDNNKSSIYETIEDTNSFESASDEIIIDYMKSSLSNLNDYMNEDLNVDDKINSLITTYYEPAMDAYTLYSQTNDDKYHDEFKKNASNYQDRIIQYNSNLSFDKSLYKYAKYINGKVCVPYSYKIDNSTLPDNYEIDNNIVYIPLNSESKTLGNE